ncbi:MAG: alanine racemase, partial [Bacteroidota bacterium]
MITRPSLLLDENICRNNIEFMAGKATKAGIRFRPHFKTHNSQNIGRWFREAGVNSITVSSVQMAEYFISDGWKDITIAFPFNILETNAVNNFPNDINLQLVVESVKTAGFLGENLRKKAGIFIKTDTGYGRTGVKPDDLALIDRITSVIGRGIKTEFLGFLAHNGHTYHAKSTEEIRNIHNESVILLNRLRDQYPRSIISVGDTPSCSLADDFSGVDEIRP